MSIQKQDWKKWQDFLLWGWIGLGFCSAPNGVIGALAHPDLEFENRYERQQLLQVAESVSWKKLLHYYRFFPWNTIRGEVDGEGFYFSPQGRRDPLAELKATLLAFERNDEVGKLKQTARCAFPERFRYLKVALGHSMDSLKREGCTDYDHFLKKMNPQGVTLVFSSAFASNPGSMFGHTFLKIQTGRQSDLLDRGVSFAATIPAGEGGFLYVIFGLMGGYAGQYSFLPYNEKVQEYVNAENRDLWEYSLQFSPEESRRLVDHLWELESNSWFDYYFINKNCSYQLLTVIEAIKPEWDLSSGWLWVVPAETVKRVIQVPGAVQAIRYRPSLRKKMMQSLDRLSQQERQDFQKLMDRQVAPAQVQSAAVLSTAIQYIQYHRAESHGSDRQDLFQLWDQTLERRSQLVSHYPVIKTYQEPQVGHPEQGHGPIRMGLSQGLTKRAEGQWFGYQELHVKPAYHDVMNNDLGYPEFSEIDFPNLTFRFYPQTGRFRLEQLQFVGMMTLVPFGFLEKRGSWKVNIEIQSPKDLSCEYCQVFHSEMAWGASVPMISSHFLAYVMGGAYFDAGSGLTKAYRLGPTCEMGFLFNPWQPYKLRIKNNFYGDLFQSDRAPGFMVAALDQSYSFNAHWETRLEWRKVMSLFPKNNFSAHYFDAKISLQYYF